MVPRSLLPPLTILVAALAGIGAVLANGGGLYGSMMQNAASPEHVLRIDLADGGLVTLPSLSGASGGVARPLVVIDPGHGGFDPGAVAPGSLEKDVVLSLAKALKTELVNRGIARVALTRSDDRYISLAERIEIARRLNADLFISIHADSAREGITAEGASIYTLSNAASSRAAAAFAARENEAAQINGIALNTGNDEVNAILVELSRRRTQEEAARFARLLLAEGDGRLAFRDEPLRSAALLVLRAPDIPSILFEVGFLSDSEDAQSMTSTEGREAFATAAANAVARFFGGRSDIAR